LFRAFLYDMWKGQFVQSRKLHAKRNNQWYNRDTILIMEVHGMELTIREETWPYIDEFFRNVPESMRKVPTFQEALAKSEQSGVQSGVQAGVRRTLLLALRHKFDEIPEEVEQLIEATNNLEQLDQWLEQTLDADALEEIAFPLDHMVDGNAP
ncbi:MAG: hypothetical protein KDE53_36375, partial [Caldilineaceae bacterium]|nr:hypothetical protein [Caldilineaceae bacterium]